MRADASKRKLGTQIADAADVELVVCRLEHDHQLRVASFETRVEELRHRALVGG